MAPPLRDHHTACSLSHAFNTIPRLSLEQYPCLHMVETEQRYQAELSGFTGVHGAIPAVGLDGV